MKKSLPCFSALGTIVSVAVAIAQSPPDSATAPLPAANASPVEGAPDGAEVGDQLLAKTATQLERRASISARLRHQVSVGGQDLYGVGSYWQQGSGEELKIRLELQIAGQDARLLQVSNSRFLWIDRRLPTGRNVIRFDLRQLRSDPALAPPDLDKLDPGKANWSTIQPLLTAHSGGLPSLLAALRDNFSFLPPQTMRLAIEQPADAPPINVPVYAIVGHWKPAKFAALLKKAEDPAKENKDKDKNDNQPQSKPKPPKSTAPPERLPQEVLLLVGQADYFPYRIEYRQLETPTAANTDGPPIPFQLSLHPLVVLELSDVVFDAPVAAGQFDYKPGDAEWTDQTAGLLDRLRRQSSQVATRSSDQSVPAR